MKQIPKWMIFVLVSIYIIILFFQMSAMVHYLSGKATTATTTLYVISADNSAPYLNSSYPNVTLYRYSAYVGLGLYAPYFIDPDNDTLTFTVSGNVNIAILINQTSGEPTFTPVGSWWGVEHVTFRATDPGGLFNYSNLVVLNVTYVEPPEPQDQASGGGRYTPRCIEKWICTDWSECIDGEQWRKCRELNNCGTQLAKPSTWQECHIDTCHDGIKNCPDDVCEEDVDCGGPCPPCGTCYDRLKNCHDGQCEEDIDCGGPCLPCSLTKIRTVVFTRAPWLILIAILASIFTIEAYIYYIKHYKIYRRYIYNITGKDEFRRKQNRRTRGRKAPKGD